MFSMMAACMKGWRTLRFLILFSLLILTEHFEVRDDEWEELRPDIAALHRLRGLSEQMFHKRLKDHLNQRDTAIHGVRAKRYSTRVDVDQSPMSLQDNMKECEESFGACVIQMEEVGGF
ncbi:uncharacterized protein LOC104935227 isoform X3 [Larimichthys crocea]|uniref:uncharacterized protein LOC104935227 isoform X3 n=1 Tax=Larimichthys crocea TaxID=215358 RepID=UPI000F5EF02D|nr:uncharacterized protein LOC104935227 isoform X3 [Larimichthys crocea]